MPKPAIQFNPASAGFDSLRELESKPNIKTVKEQMIKTGIIMYPKTIRL
jgi:hypothetical protein